jgi:hypothetical protein
MTFISCYRQAAWHVFSSVFVQAGKVLVDLLVLAVVGARCLLLPLTAALMAIACMDRAAAARRYDNLLEEDHGEW